jgi:hypothetical protein
MDPTAQNSFIPKKNLDAGMSRHGRGAGTGLVLLVSILFFITSLVAAGGIFVYKGVLKGQITSKGDSLALNEKAFDSAVIQKLLRMDQRLNEAGELLQNHIAPSAIFAYLSQQTLERVQLTGFSYEIKDGAATISLKGQADSFSSIALQSDQFAASKVLKDIIFSGVDVDAATGKVGFTVEASIIPSLIQYSSVLSASPATLLPETSPTNASTTAQ